MARIRCLHLADLHLGWTPSQLGGREEERQRERDQLLKRAVDLALTPTSGIRLVIIAGDLFETHRPGTELVEAVLRELRRLEQANIPVITVPGNHDEITYHDSVYRQRRNDWPGFLVTNPMPEKVATLSLEDTPCHLYAMAYTGGLTKATELLREFPPPTESGVHLGVFHGSLDWEAGERSMPLSSQGLAAAGYDYVALGHLHRYQEKTVNRTLMVYPGAVEGKTFTDPGTGFFTVVELGDGFPVVEQVPAAVRAYRQVKIDVSGMETEADLGKELEKVADPEALVQIRLVGVFSFLPNLAKLTAGMREGFYHLEICDDTEHFNLETLKGWATEPTLRGAFLRRMLQRLEAAADQRERKIAYLALVKGISAFTKGE
ncbi:MAG: DNA repair exonuclease [Firmicutes bacterium]|nr:DNA repair exonuclease [Bacillota bacterium]